MCEKRFDFGEEIVEFSARIDIAIVLKINVRQEIRFRFQRVLAKIKCFGKKWPTFWHKPKQSVFLKFDIVIKHFRIFYLFYNWKAVQTAAAAMKCFCM